MSLLLPPIQPEEGAAAEVEDFERLEELVSERRHNFSGWCAFTDVFFCVLALTLSEYIIISTI